jgi:hypothetical protein
MLPNRAPTPCATTFAKPAHIGAAMLVPPTQQFIAAVPLLSAPQ